MEKIHNYMAESLLSISPTASILEASHVMNDNEIHSFHQTWKSQESMEKAAQTMRDHSIHHLAVTEHGQMLGTLSINDYHKYLVLKPPKWFSCHAEILFWL